MDEATSRSVKVRRALDALRVAQLPPEQWAEVHAHLESLRHGLDRARTEEVDKARARLEEFSGLRISTRAGSLGPAPDPIREVITEIEGRLDPKPPASDDAGSGAGDSREP